MPFFTSLVLGLRADYSNTSKLEIVPQDDREVVNGDTKYCLSLGFYSICHFDNHFEERSENPDALSHLSFVIVGKGIIIATTY